MSKPPPVAITITDVDIILQSTEDAIAAFTAQASLVKRLHQQNQDLVAQQQQQQSELKATDITTQASMTKPPSVTNETVLNHQNIILQAQIELLQMRLTQEKENAMNDRLAKLNVINQLKRKIQTYMDIESPISPPSPLRPAQRYRVQPTATKKSGPFHRTFNHPSTANVILQTPVKPTAVSPIVPSPLADASPAAPNPAVASSSAASSIHLERVLSILNEHLQFKIENSVTKFCCTVCDQVVLYERVKEDNMNFNGFTSGTKCLTCDTLDHTDWFNLQQTQFNSK